MKHTSLFLAAILVLAVAAGCSGTSRGVEVENPTPEIDAPTPYRNMTVGIEITPAAGWTFAENGDMDVQFLRQELGNSESFDIAFLELSSEENIKDRSISSLPGMTFAAMTLGDFECLASEIVLNGTSNPQRSIFCDLGNFLMRIEHRLSPIVTTDFLNQSSFRTIRQDGFSAVQNVQQTEEDDTVTEKPDCSENPKAPGCVKKTKKVKKEPCGGSGPDADNDCDGLSNLKEKGLHTDPNDFDTDGDGFRDGEDACPLDPNPDDDAGCGS